MQLTDDFLDRIDEIVPPGSDVRRMDQTYDTPPVVDAELRRRLVGERAAEVPDAA